MKPRLLAVPAWKQECKHEYHKRSLGATWRSLPWGNAETVCIRDPAMLHDMR